jgi:putative aminopeptidase FrvX
MKTIIKKKKKILKKTVPITNKEFLFKYLNNSSPTGFESSGQKIWMDYLNPYVDKFVSDSYGSVAGIIENKKSDYKVVIEAHADEIAWFVNYISDDGYLYVIRLGGSDTQIAPSKRVNIYTETGEILKGVFGWPAIHVREKETKPEEKNIFIDIGASSKAEAEKMGIHVGAVAVFEDQVIELNEKFIVGRALDNRMGGYMIAQVAKKLKENKVTLPYNLYIVNAVQEEIGLKGAQMISRSIKPDVAICTDVTHDNYTPMNNKVVEGDIKCGRGPVLCYGPSIQNNLLQHIIKTANDRKIPFQRQAASASSGTDTDSFAYSTNGVPSALISLPLKYMHTTVETVMYEDVTLVIDLIYHTLLKIKDKQSFKYFEI